ncbi:alanine racemase [Rhizohabitans arisaemae]|uniref:alanine racemase n=1 Tax=Rhizohabitans arisaemae TaxID=2720610 RepID=UPI0024B0E513|nr:alanine racemase [Rhizohabitans arisaemae]
MSPFEPVRLSELPTPALLIDRTRLVRNIADMSAMAASAGVRLRPHFKASKCLDVARLQLAHGAIGFTCATMAEVAVLLDAGITDLVWAHQPVGPAKVAFAVRTGVTVAIDSVEVARPLAEAAQTAGRRVPYLIEVDTGLGRAGVAPEDAVALAGELAAYPSLELRGVLTHEGHLMTYLGDRTGMDNAGRLVGEVLAGVAGELRAAGHPCEIVSVGSTPGAATAPFVPGVTEARAGTYVFYDGNQVALGTADESRTALTVLTRVVSTKRDGTAIVDAGLKAMSSDASVTGSGFGLVVGRPSLAFAKANEEHGYLTGRDAKALRVGDPLHVLPNHGCGVVNMWSSAYLVEGDTAVARWRISGRH